MTLRGGEPGRAVAAGAGECAARAALAQAMGVEPKTDAADARTLVAMGTAVEVRRVGPRSPAQRYLDELVTACNALSKVSGDNQDENVATNKMRKP
ncbi:MAG: hypothetical protein OXM01_12705, partial [Gemmatimonadota bacterium]|nr:hypothetical protein [Gemmatimonadota bacterium]